jgi:hypothetical protein
VDNLVASTKAAILEMVESHWNRTGRAFLIAQLGTRLGAPRRAEIEAHTGLKLQPFLFSYMQNDLKIMEHPRAAKIFGLFPKNSPLSNDLTLYFGPSDEAKRQKHYKASFWAAFAKPLGSDNRRHIRIRDLIFFDLPLDAPEPPETREISRDLIPSEDTASRDKVIFDNIQKWLAQNQIDEPALLVDRPTVYKKPDADATSVLHAIISCLDDGDLKRMMMPLDVVAKLLRSRF